MKHVVDGSTEIRQYRLGAIFVGTETGNRRPIDSYDSQKIVAHTEGNARNHIERTESVAAGEPRLAAEFHFVLPSDPMKRVAEHIERGNAALWIVVGCDGRRSECQNGNVLVSTDARQEGLPSG